MFILKTKTQLEKAITKAKQPRPRVEFDAFGRYRVSGSRGGFYTVICKKSDNNYRLVECTCKGGGKALGLLSRRRCTGTAYGTRETTPNGITRKGFPKPASYRKASLNPK